MDSMMELANPLQRPAPKGGRGFLSHSATQRQEPGRAYTLTLRVFHIYPLNHWPNQYQQHVGPSRTCMTLCL
eukprot:scaffold252521_cov15-Tisochrysis_lutea.AAC.1